MLVPHFDAMGLRYVRVDHHLDRVAAVVRLRKREGAVTPLLGCLWLTGAVRGTLLGSTARRRGALGSSLLGSPLDAAFHNYPLDLARIERHPGCRRIGTGQLQVRLVARGPHHGHSRKGKERQRYKHRRQEPVGAFPRSECPGRRFRMIHVTVRVSGTHQQKNLMPALYVLPGPAAGGVPSRSAPTGA